MASAGGANDPNRRVPQKIRWPIRGIAVLVLLALGWPKLVHAVLREPGLIYAAPVLMAILSLWWLPKWQVAQVSDLAKRVELEDKTRLTLAQILGGAVILLGAYVAWGNFRVAQEAQMLSEEGQMTERFGRAIDQIGATDKEGKPVIEIRLGGIYALEQLSRHAGADPTADLFKPIMEVLAAYVRRNAVWSDQLATEQSNRNSRLEP